MCSNLGIVSWLLVAAAVAFCPIAGCSPPPLVPPAAARASDVVLVDHAGLMAAVAAQRGRIVVLDCWSTSCPPCVKEFPGLVALAEKYHGQVACLSLSFDYEGIGTPEAILPRVRSFLENVGADRIENMLTKEDADSLYKQLDLVSIPAVYVWKADGTLARRFDDDDAARRLGRPFTYADVEAEVRSLLPTTTP
jgi:thiol-disulfide isomerase/thioredoxin